MVNHAILFALLFVVFRLYLLKFIYLLVLPGFCILLLTSKFDFKKTLLLSFPASLVLYIYPYFLITRSLLPIPPWIYLLLPLVLALVVFKKGLFELEFKNAINYKDLFYSILPVAILLIVYYPYFTRGEVSLTAGTNSLLFQKINVERILNEWKVPIWTQAEYAGSHFYYTYPPLTYVTTALLNAIPTEAVNYTTNLTVVALYLYMLFASYMLFRSLKLGKSASVLGISIMMGVPILVGEPTYSGNITMAYMFSLYPAALYGFFNMFKEKRIKDVIFLSFTVASFVIVYHHISYFMLIPAFVTAGAYFLVGKEKKLLLKNAIVFFSVIAVLIGAWALRLIFTSEFVTTSGVEGSWNKPLSNFTEFLSFIAATGRETDDLYKQVITLTPLFFWLGFVSMFLALRIENSKIKILNTDLLLLAYFAFLFFLIICEIFPFHTMIPLRDRFYRIFRYWEVLVPLFAFGIGRLYENASNMFGYKPLLFGAFLLIFAPMIAMSKDNASNWLVENAIVTDKFSELTNLLRNLPDRVALFGGYGPAMIPAIQNWSGKAMLKGYNFQRHASKLVYENLLNPLSEASMDYIKNDVTPVKAYNIFQVSGTNTLVYFACDQKGANALNLTASYNGYELIAQGRCLVVLSLRPKSSLVEKVKLACVNASDDVKAKVLDYELGYKVIMPYYELNKSECAFVVDKDFVLKGNYSIFNYLSESLDYKFLSDESLIINASPGWILFKGAYFPTMHAYQDGKELVVLPTYHGMTLIKSLSDKQILLVHKPHYSEILGLLLYLGFIVLLFAIHLHNK